MCDTVDRAIASDTGGPGARINSPTICCHFKLCSTFYIDKETYLYTCYNLSG